MIEGRVAGAASRMRAWRVHSYGGLADLRLDSTRVPALRNIDDILVEVETASLNPIDAAMLDGYGSRLLNVLRRAEGVEELPLVPGRDVCGRVVRAGAAAAARLPPGARVWGVLPPHRPGALAQFALLKHHWAGPAPETLDAAQAGGALYAALTACSALRAAGVAPGGARAGRAPRVLLLGLGGVGQAALQLLAHQGAHVVVGCSGELGGAARALGAGAALDRHAPDYERQLRDAGPYDVVLDCCGLGGAGAGRWAGARYVTLSSPLLRLTDERGLLAGAAAAAAGLAAQTAAALRASAPAAPPACPPVRWAYFAPRADDIELLRRLAERGKFRVSVERVFGWWEAAAAFERVAGGHARGKLVLDFSARAPAPAAPPAPAAR